MTVLVTGAAGFIGSHLCDALLARGEDVVGVDCFTDYYPRRRKEANLAPALEHPSFRFVERDLSHGEVDDLLQGTQVVFHLGAQAGVRSSFGDGFADYLRNNLQVTQRLLEAVPGTDVDTFVYASSSSVYGNPRRLPTEEGAPRRPCSPYGLSKVATEDLAEVYHRTAGIATIGLRYFTVYGPRQRPDMAFNRFIGHAMSGRPLQVFGTGDQTRDFTYVEDAVRGTIAAADHGVPGSVYNIGGGTPVALRDAIRTIARTVGDDVRVEHHDVARGDVLSTCADGSRAASELGFRPTVSIEEGIARQVEWQRGLTYEPEGCRVVDHPEHDRAWSTVTEPALGFIDAARGLLGSGRGRVVAESESRVA